MGDMERWKGKAAMITGASSGIGKAAALALSRAGMRVALAARRADRLAEIEKEIASAGGRALCLPTDLCDEAQILKAFDAVRDEWGGVDVLINSAGIGRLAPLMSGKTEHFRRMLEVNVLALIIATREAVKDMRSRGASGHIVHISSLSAYRVQTGSSMYAATKFAVRALTEGLRRELKEAGGGIRVTALSPGDTESEFMEVLWGSKIEAHEHRPRYETMSPEDIADAVLYVLSTPANVEVHDILLRPVGQPD